MDKETEIKKTTFAGQCLGRDHDWTMNDHDTIEELARRLKRACEVLRAVGKKHSDTTYNWKTLIEHADKLEAPLVRRK